MDKVRSGTLRYRSAEHTTDSILLRPGVAVVRGTMRGEVEIGGQVKQLCSETLVVWLEDDGAWRLAAFQPTPVAAGRR